MKKRTLGKAGLEVSELGLGYTGMSLGERRDYSGGGLDPSIAENRLFELFTAGRKSCAHNKKALRRTR
jgi:hypothetical protein